MSAAQQLAEQVQQIQQAYQSGQISPAEYKELINNMNLVETINSNAATFEQEKEARAIILGAIQLAGAIY
jgi:hypothetical protein